MVPEAFVVSAKGVGMDARILAGLLCERWAQQAPPKRIVIIERKAEEVSKFGSQESMKGNGFAGVSPS
jgi:mannose/fructose/N-acetylgalactosamine-specific phosphotransferase system component IIB